MSENTRWIVGTGIVLLIAIIASVYTGVSHLIGLQTQMEDRLSKNITGTEERIAERIDRVDTRLTTDVAKVQVELGKQIGNVATDLRTVEGETAPLAGLEVRLTETIQGSETRLSREVQDAEKRLTARIDKIDDRLLKVEGESARLSTIVKNNWAPGEASWSFGYGPVSELMVGGTTPVAVGEWKKALETMKDAGINVQWIGKPVSYRAANQSLLDAYRQTLQKYPELAEEVVNAYAKLMREQLGLDAEDAATDTPADAKSE